jgi:hypothetical protein
MAARYGLTLVLATTAAAIALFALALRARSWPLWLLAFAVTILALGVAWAARASVPSAFSVP